MNELANGLRGGLVDPSSDYLSGLANGASGGASQWLLVATILVLFMQTGFLLLESGSVRSKNTINVSLKNVVDMIICGCAFLAVGASIMFGAGSTGWCGFGGFDLTNSDTQLRLLFQFAFCATAATIISGAVAERMTFNAYMILAAVMAVLIYPVFGHLVWGNALIPGNPSFLADMGFLDFSGSTVVHAIGGWASLAAVLAIGPRKDRFDSTGKIIPMPGHSSVLALSGLMILVLGWIGFNTGSAVPGTAVFSQIALNTVVALCFGGAAGMIYDMSVNKGRLRPRAIVSSILGGLVAITAGCAYVDHFSAMIIGATGGLTATIMADVLLKRFKLDDPVDAIACHGVTGLIGTLLVAVFALPEYLVNGSRLEQLIVQMTGSVIAFIWAFGITFAVLFVMKRLGMAIRVTAEEEEIGLNLSEHGEGFDIESLKELIAGEKTNSANSVLRMSQGEANILDGIGGEAIDETNGYDRNNAIGLLGKVVGKAKAIAEENEYNIERLNDIEKVGNDWLFETDAVMQVSRISEKFFKTFGENARGVVGRSYFDLLTARDTSVEQHKNQITRREAFDDLVFGVVGPDRVERIFSVSGIPKFSSDGRFEGYRGRASDVTDKVKADEEIRFMALHDHLTGLKNRAAFDHFGNVVLKNNELVLIGTIDLDGFKNVNDTFGHQTGDSLLKLVATRISEHLGDDAIVSRFGGDEFVFAKPLKIENWQADMKTVSDGLVDWLCAPAVLDGLELFIGGSLGVAVYPDHHHTMSELLRLSDMALYEAKQMGRGQWVPFRQELEDRAKRRKRLETDMRAAIENREFFVEYQPQVSAEERKLKGFEALARWQHPEFGLIAPLEFIVIAEETGLIVELGEYVLREACQSAANWPLINGEACMISVNVSPVQFFKQDLVKLVSRVLADSALDPKRLEIEVTESALVKDPEDATRVLNDLRALGIRVAVDDFGTGYSSLSFLQQFPLDRLKVDRTFVKNLARGGNDYRIAQAIIQLGKSLGLNVIAEGVETQDQFETLAEINIDEIQGFLFSPPVSTAASLAMIIKANEIKNAFDDCLTPEYSQKLESAGA
jgi:ammonium transporter, Amt family